MKRIAWVLATAVLFGCARNTPAPVEQLYTGKTYKDYQANSLARDSYQVTAGETLYSIAFRANQDVQVIARLNNLSEPYTIYPGQTLKLRADGGQTNQSKTIAQTKANNNTAVDSKKDIKQPIAKPQQKEYGQKVDTKKSVAKQTAKPKKQVSPQNNKRRPVVVRKTEQRSVKNDDIQWRWPSTGNVIEGFSLSEQGNKGLDFAGQRGNPVTAAAAGKVVYVGEALRGYGKLIILKHNSDFITAYAHNDKILVQEQDWVDVGDTIAEMGSSGRPDVRLHFEVRFRGKSVNPRHYLPNSRE